MALKVQRILVCDMSERHPGDIRPYRITRDGQSVSLDLCPRCSQKIEDLIERAGKQPTNTSRLRVFSMEEVQARKQEEPPTPVEG